MPNALIFGASGTFGSAIATELIARGYSVGLHAHTHAERCEPLRALAAARDLKAEEFVADVNDLAQMNALALEFVKKFERVDCIVWACGIVKDAPLVTQDEADLRAVLNTDLKAFFVMLKSFSRQFIKQKSGSVLALTSHAGISGRVGGSAYAMAQSGLAALVKSAAREWGGLGVRVNAVAPPFVESSGMGQAATPEFIAAATRKRVLKSDPDALSNFSRFAVDVLSNSSLSGQILVADGRVID